MHGAVAAYKDDFVVFAVGIGGEPLFECEALLVLPCGDEIADLGFQVHEETLCGAGALELVAELLGDDARGGRMGGDRLGGGLEGGGSRLAVV